MVRLVVLAVTALLAACAGQGDGTARLRTGPAGLGVADAALGAGSPEIALTIARGILAGAPRDAGALVRQGEALAQLGRGNEAADSFNRALLSDPGAAPAHLGLARLLLLGGDAARAEAELKRALEHDPRDVRAIVDLGIARDLLGRHGEAQQAYRDALALSPGLTAARVNMGLSLALAGNGEDAATALRPLAEQPDAAPSVRHDLAVALAIGGHTNEAERAMARDVSATEAHDAVAVYGRMRGGGI